MTFKEVPYPDIPEVCQNQDHWINLLAEGMCYSCGGVMRLPPPTDQEINEMFALAGSESDEYRTAHD